MVKNKQKVALIKKDKEQDNHVVAIKNKLYDNSALEASTNASFEGAPVNLSTQQKAKYRTDSAAVKPGFALKMNKGNSASERRSYILPNVQENFNNQYKSYGRLDPPTERGREQQQLPSMTEFDFAAKYRDRMLQQFPKANMPHMKRIIN